MTVQNLYTQYLDGKVTKAKFLYEVRRDQNLDMISHHNNFDDTIKILKNKNIISEKASKESTGKQDVEIIAKTIDMVNPYEYARGMKFELEMIDIPTRTDLTEEEVLKAQKKVLANLTKNPQFYFDKINGKGEVSDKWVETTKKNIDAIGKGKAAKGLMRESKLSEAIDVSKDRLAHREAIKLYHQGESLYKQGKKEEAEKLRQQALKNGKETEFPKYSINEGYENDGLVKEDQQNAIFEKYSQATGIPIDNLRSMVRDAKEKKNKVDEDLDQHYTEDDIEPYSDGQNYTDITDIENLTREQLAVLRQIVQDWGLTEYDLEDPAVLSDVEEELSIRMKAVTDTDQSVINPSKPMNEDCNGCERETEEENEPHELHILLSQLSDDAMGLSQELKALEAGGVDNLPQWLQAKIIIAKSYIHGVKEYLEGEMGNNDELEESGFRVSDKLGGNQYFRTDSDANAAINTAKKSGITLTKTNIPE